MTDYYNKDHEGHLRVEINTKDYKERDKNAIFFKVADVDGDYGFTTLGIDQTVALRDELTKLIEEFEALKPKEKTRTEIITEFSTGTVFTAGIFQSKFVRLSGDRIFNVAMEQAGTVGDFFHDSFGTKDIKVVES